MSVSPIAVLSVSKGKGILSSTYWLFSSQLFWNWMRKQYINLLGAFKDLKTKDKLITVACKQDTHKK